MEEKLIIMDFFIMKKMDYNPLKMDWSFKTGIDHIAQYFCHFKIHYNRLLSMKIQCGWQLILKKPEG